MGLRWVRIRARRAVPRHLAVVMAAVLILFLGAVWAGAQASPEPLSPPPQPSPTQYQAPSTGLPSTGLQPGWEGEAGTLAAGGPSAMDYLAAALKFGLVLLILYGALWALRRYARTGFVRGARDSRRLALLETLPLAPRQALHLVRADERTFLVGVSEHGVVLLTELTAPVDDGGQGTELAVSPSLCSRAGFQRSAPSSPWLREGQGGVSHLASAFAQQLRQAINRRGQHGA